MPRILLLAIASVVLLAPGTVSAQGYSLEAYSTCTSSDSVYVIWTVYEPTGPNAYPDFVGYDVLRRNRTQTDCGTFDSFVRVNDEIIPRQVGQTHTRHFGEVIPTTGTLFEYWVQPVDVNHERAYPCCGFCLPCNVFEICPELSAPVTVGTLEDWGWTLAVMPCPGSCYPGAYLGDPATVDALRPYAGTGATFRFFGRMGCGTTEGCSLDVDHWEPTTCVTSVTSRTWGRLKTIYR